MIKEGKITCESRCYILIKLQVSNSKFKGSSLAIINKVSDANQANMLGWIKTDTPRLCRDEQDKPHHGKKHHQAYCDALRSCLDWFLSPACPQKTCSKSTNKHHSCVKIYFCNRIIHHFWSKRMNCTDQRFAFFHRSHKSTWSLLQISRGWPSEDEFEAAQWRYWFNMHQASHIKKHGVTLLREWTWQAWCSMSADTLERTHSPVHHYGDP